MIEDEYEIEIGARGHLAAAELAHGDDGAATARDPAVALGDIARHRRMQTRKHDIGKIGKRPARFRRTHGLGQDAHANAERLFLGHHPDTIDRLIERSFPAALLPPPELEISLALGSAPKKPGSSTASRTLGRWLNSLGETRRGAEDRGDKIEQVGIGLEQREELNAGRESGQKTVEGDEGLVGIAALGERGQKRRHDFGQKLAGAGAARGAG